MAERTHGDSGRNAESGATDITAIALLITPFVAALGALALTGTIGRVQRNEPEMISWALFLVLAAGTLWVISSEFSSLTKGIRVVACLAALGGFVLGLSAAVQTANDEPRPQIKARLSDDAHKLTVEIGASNMETEDRLAIFVDALTRGRRNPEKYTSEPVYRGYGGPDADGNVTTTVSVFLPKGNFTDVGIKAFTDKTSPACDDQLAKDAASPDTEPKKSEKPGSGTGCVTMALISK